MGRRGKRERSGEGRGERSEASAGTAPFSLVRRPGQSALPQPRVPSRSPTLAICGLLLLAVIAVYGQTAWFDFLNYDDGTYVADNAAIRQGFSWKGIAWSFTAFDGANWHPVTWLSHMLDCRLFGLRGGWHHAVNVMLHAANSILLFVLLLRMTAATWRSAAVAALFALHPLHVESVAWVAERKDVLSTLFAMLAMLAHVRYVARPSPVRYLAVVVPFVLGLMSKPMLVTLPFVLLLLDYWPLGRWQGQSVPEGQKCRVGRAERAPPSSGNSPGNSWWGSLRLTHPTVPQGSGLAGRTAFWLVIEKVPLLLLAAGSCVVTCIAQQSKGAMAMLSEQISLPMRLANALVSYVAYLGKMVWPERLMIFYPFPTERPWWQAALAAAFLIAVTGAAVWWWRKRPYLAVGWFWYLGTLVPVIGLVQVGAQAMADRYTYIPLIGIFIAVVWGIGELAGSSERFPRRETPPDCNRGALQGGENRHGIIFPAILAAGVLAACMILSARQVAHWADSEALFTYVLRVSPENAVGHCNLGDELLRQGRYAEAEKHYRELARIEPKARAYAQLRWGQTLAKRDRPAEAVSHFREAVRLDPDMAVAHFDLAMALVGVGKPQEVIEHLYAADRLAPDKPEVLKNLAWALTHCPDRKLRDAAKGVELAERAVKLSDRQEPGYLATLAVAYAEAGRPSEALQVAEEAIALAAVQKKAAPADALRVRRELRQAGSSRRTMPRSLPDSARP